MPHIGKRTFVPASSAPSERAFSCAGLAVTKLRNRLTSENVEAIDFLHIREGVLQIGLSVSVFCAFFLSTLADDFAALHCAYFVSLPNFGFDICGSDSIRNQLRFGYGHSYAQHGIWTVVKKLAMKLNRK